MWDHAFMGAVAGLVAGMMALSMLGRLLALVGQTRAAGQGWGTTIAAALFSSGTWVMLAIFAGTFLMLRDDAPGWLPWFMTALWTWILGFGAFVWYLMRRPPRPPPTEMPWRYRSKANFVTGCMVCWFVMSVAMFFFWLPMPWPLACIMTLFGGFFGGGLFGIVFWEFDAGNRELYAKAIGEAAKGKENGIASRES